jgi:hypothetical protein
MTPIAERAGHFIDVDDLPAAANAIQEAEASGESAAVLDYLRGRMCMCRKDWAAAYLHLAEFVRVDPEHIDGASKFADVCFMLERWAEAVAPYHRVVARYPGWVQPWMNLAVCYERQEQYRNALQAMTYVRACEISAFRDQTLALKKRDWLLSTLTNLAQLGPQQIERKYKLGGDEFRDRYYVTNRPVIISGMMDDWPALDLWSLQYFKDRFGKMPIEVQADRDSDYLYRGIEPERKRTMRCADVMSEMMAKRSSNDLYMMGTNAEANIPFLKLLTADIRNVDEYLLGGDLSQTSAAGNNCFWSLWLGPAGTFIPAHYDPSNGLLAQVFGRKRAWLAPASAMPNVYNYPVGVFSQVDFRDIDYVKFPLMRDVKLLECEIGPGDLLFIPVGWWHAIEALEPSASVRFGHFKWGNTDVDTSHLS